MTTKESILQKAQELFITKGYDATSVQNIIDAVGIAKGTFYHHFQSKEMLLEEITMIVTKTAQEKIQKQLAKEKLDAVTKLNRFFAMHSQWKTTQYDVLYLTLSVMYAEKNYMYLKKIKEKNREYYLPVMQDIINQGVEENCFDTPYVDEIGDIIIRLSNDFSDTLAEIFLKYKEYDNPVAELDKKMNMFLHCIERLLGMKKHQHIDRIDTKLVSDFINFMKEKEDSND